MNDKFTYKSKYGEYKNCFFRVSKYIDNGNTAIEIWSADEGPVTRVTVNTDIKLSSGCIAVKDYYENEGMADWLISKGIIEPEPVMKTTSRWVSIPIYVLTEYGREVLGIS